MLLLVSFGAGEAILDTGGKILFEGVECVAEGVMGALARFDSSPAFKLESCSPSTSSLMSASVLFGFPFDFLSPLFERILSGDAESEGLEEKDCSKGFGSR